MRHLVALAVIAHLAGCTIVFPVVGGASAASSNSKSRAQGEPETSSVGGNIALGLLLGVVTDLVVLTLIFKDAYEHQPEG
jgi:hypothetical protein